MQPLSWYRRRLQSMSGGEIVWRIRAKLRDATDRWVDPLRRRGLGTGSVTAAAGDWLGRRPEVLGNDLPTPGDSSLLATLPAGALDHLIARADRLARNRLDLFDLEDLDLGETIDWNYEHKAGKKTPTGFAPAIDYRDHEETGDCKFVWEPSRHAHLVVLARAYRATGESRYAEAVVDQIASWMSQCPYGSGMNWRSPLELGIRLINWVWALELIQPSGLVTADRLPDLPTVVYRHLWDIQRKYSRFSSANNHLIGEAAGVYIGSAYFADLKNADAWRQESRQILVREAESQTRGDGGNCEQAMGYHLFVLEFLLLAGLAGRNIGEEFPTTYWENLGRMLEFVGAFSEGGGQLPMYGDCDDGYVLDLADRTDQARELLAVGATLLGRSDLKTSGGGYRETVTWLLGPTGREMYEAVPSAPPAEPITSRAFPETGYYLLQSGHRGSDDRISVTFDCGELGFGSIAAHGHADALSFTLRAFGRDIFVDPGTYDYFTYRPWRDYFRSTRAHNTVVVDDEDQSQMLGPFLWGDRASTRCLKWEPSDNGGEVCGEHDGYARLPGRVIHQRTVRLDGDARCVVISDLLEGQGRHTAALHLHLAEGCSAAETAPGCYRIDCGRRSLEVELDPGLAISLVHGQDRPIMGWASRRYHKKAPVTTLVARAAWERQWRSEVLIRPK